jgi:hypothetical protein
MNDDDDDDDARWDDDIIIKIGVQHEVCINRGPA